MTEKAEEIDWGEGLPTDNIIIMDLESKEPIILWGRAHMDFLYEGRMVWIEDGKMGGLFGGVAGIEKQVRGDTLAEVIGKLKRLIEGDG